MPRYLIERQLPGAGDLSSHDLPGIARKSCDVLTALGPQSQWVQSYVTDATITGIYLAPNEQIIREHAARGGFPVTKISEVRAVIDPQTSEVGAAQLRAAGL